MDIRVPDQSQIPSATYQPANDTAIGQGLIAQVDVTEVDQATLAGWLKDKIERSVTEKADLDSRLVVWHNQYEGIPTNPKKDWPWVGASNLVVPITASHVDAVLARLLGSVFGAKQLWVGTAKSAKWVPLVNPIEVFVNYVGKDVLDMYRVSQRWFLQMLKYGTGVLKLPWERITRRVTYKDSQGGVVTEDVTRHNGPRAYVVPIADFYVTPDAYATLDIQNCEGVFQRCLYTKKTLLEKQRSGIFRDVDKILKAPRSTQTDMQLAEQQASKISLSTLDDFEVWECWISYDPKNDGNLVEMVVDFHKDTLTVLRCVYNFYRHQERPFHLIKCMPRDGSLWGIGICQMLEDVQNEITTTHNLRLDNATIANSVAFKVKRNAHMEEVEIYPGAYVPFDDPDDIQPLEIGVPHSTLLPEELHTNSIGERRTGVSDYTVGRESAAIGSNATATSTLALIREGNKRFQMMITDIRKALTDIAHQVIMLYQQFAQDSQVIYELFDDKELMWVQKYFKMPPEFSRANIAIDVPALSEAQNKDTDKQNLLTLMGVMQNFYGSMFQAYSMAINPQAPQQLKSLAGQAAIAGSKLFSRILEAFEFRDPDTFAPDVESMLGLTIAQNAQQQGGPFGPTAGGAAQAPGGQQPGPAMAGGEAAAGGQDQAAMAALLGSILPGGGGGEATGGGPMAAPSGGTAGAMGG